MWVKSIKARGVVGCHPDDGWVDRENGSIELCYPEIWGEIKIGALFALGDHDKCRIVRFTRFERQRVMIDPGIPYPGKWFYEEIQAEAPRAV